MSIDRVAFPPLCRDSRRVVTKPSLRPEALALVLTSAAGHQGRARLGKVGFTADINLYEQLGQTRRDHNKRGY